MSITIEYDREKANWVHNFLKEHAEYFTQNYSDLLEEGGTFEAVETFGGRTVWIEAERYNLSQCSICGMKGKIIITYSVSDEMLVVRGEFNGVITDDMDYELMSKMNFILQALNTSVYVDDEDKFVIKSKFNTSLKYGYGTIDDGDFCEVNQFDLVMMMQDFILEQIKDSGRFQTIINFITECDCIDDDTWEELKMEFW